VKQAEGIRDSTRIKADGDAAAVRTVGQAQADAYNAQAIVIGADRVALVRVMEQVSSGNVRITPDTLVTAGADSGANTLFAAYLATLLSRSGGTSSAPTRSEPGTATTPAAPPPPKPSDKRS
jgi:regulator of protease activity HflC (stomatin/prohibitin superfamily)